MQIYLYTVWAMDYGVRIKSRKLCTFDHFVAQACKTLGRIIVNLLVYRKIEKQEEAIASSCLVLATPLTIRRS